MHSLKCECQTEKYLDIENSASMIVCDLVKYKQSRKALYKNSPLTADTQQYVIRWQLGLVGNKL